MPLPQVAIRTIVLLLMIINLTGCFKLSMTRDRVQTSQSARTSIGLTQEEANFRQSVLSGLGYELYLDVSEPGSSQYSGRVSITFALLQANKPLRLDFQQGEISRLLINSQPVDAQYDGRFITFAPGSLQQGQNTVEIEFLQNYSRNGTGLNRFQDTVDQQLYLFNQPLPYRSSRLFPLFDQPDLKASYKLTVKSPERWQVMTITPEKQTIKDGKKRWWYFSASDNISPSLFSLSAGPFRVWKNSSGAIPLRLAVRQSLAWKIHPQTWFSLSQQGLQFFGQYLDKPYPGLQFDLILLPSLTGPTSLPPGYLDEFLTTSIAVKENPEIQAQTIYQNLAHHWLAHSVSPAWWDSVWLQESLIRFLSFKAMAEGAHLKGTWPFFYRSQKVPAYEADAENQPPALIIKAATTQDALRHIKAPLYPSIQGKGPALLHQLEYRLSKETFRQGLRDFLNRHQDKGTKVEVFIQTMQEASGENLKHWTDVWYYKTGSNQVKAQWECKDQFLTKITLLQSAPGTTQNVLREQRVNTGLYHQKSHQKSHQKNHQKNHQLTLYRSLPVLISGKKTKVPYSGKTPCPDAVFPNTDDHGYLVLKLDDISLKAALDNRGDSAMLETQLIDLLYNEVKLGQVDIHALLNRLYKQIPEETTPTLLFQSQQVLTELYTTLQTIRYQDESLAETLADPLFELESFVWQQLMIAIPGSTEQESWFRTYLVVAHSQAGLARLEDLLDHRPLLSELKVTKRQRWDMLQKLLEHNYPGSEKRINQESESAATSSAISKNEAVISQALRPDIKVKQFWIQRFQEAGSDHLKELVSLRHNLFPPSQIQLAQQLAGQTLDGLQYIVQQPRSLQRSYLNYVVPDACSVHGITQFKNAMSQYQVYPFIHYQLSLKKSAAERCLNMRTRLKTRSVGENR